MKSKSRILERQLELYKIFQLAIKAEQSAQQMYQGALSRCDDPELKGILESLRDDELRHEKEVREMYRELKQLIDIEESVASNSESSTHAKARNKNAKKQNAP